MVYGADDPTDDEWREYLALVERHGIDRTMQLVFTDVGAPVRLQRRYLNKITNGRIVPVAIVSSNAQVRGLVSVMALFGRHVRPFQSSEQGVRAALAYLEIPPTRYEIIDNARRLLRTEIRG